MRFAPLLACAVLLTVLPACEKKSPTPAPPLPAPAPVTPAPPPDTAGTEKTNGGPGDEVKDFPDPLQGLKQVDALPEEFYGKWRNTGSDGGMDGQGDRKPAGEIIAITKKNEIETWVEGKLVSTVKFRAARGRSIFSNDNWIISRSAMDTEVVVVREDKLTISENHPDGYGWSYERVR